MKSDIYPADFNRRHNGLVCMNNEHNKKNSMPDSNKGYFYWH